MNWITNLSPPNITRLAELATSPRGVAVFCIVILSIAVLVLIRFWWITRPPIKELKAGKKKLEAMDGEQAFAEGYQEFDEWARSQKKIGHLWFEFTETLIFPGPDDRPVVRNISPTEIFFSEDRVLTRYNLRFYQGFQNYLTGAGILGTFVGLFAAIHLAKDGLQAPQINEIKIALSQLLGGASLAFLTSIAGLASSILFSTLEKLRHHKLRDLTTDWGSLLDERLELVTLEDVGLKALKEARNQTTELRRFNTDLAVSIAGALDEKLSARMAPAMDRLVQAVDKLREDRSTDNVQALSEMVNKFETALSGTAKSEIDGLATTVRVAADGIGAAASQLTSGHAETAHQLGAMVTQMSDFLDQTRSVASEERARTQQEFNSSLVALSDQVQSAVSDLSVAATTASESLIGGTRDSAEHLKETLRQSSAQLLSSMDTLNSLTDRLHKNLAQLSDVSQTLGQTHQQMGNTSSSLTAAAGRLNEALPTLHNSIEKMGGLADVAQEVLSAIGAQHEALKQTLSDYERRFQGVDEHAQRMFESLNGHVETYSDSILDYSQKIQAGMVQAVQQLSGAINELGETLEDLPTPSN